MERARSELLNAAGIDLARFTHDHGVLFVVFQIAVTYHEPARLNDLLSVSAEVAKMGRASLVFRQRVERGAELLCEADVTVAIYNPERRGRQAVKANFAFRKGELTEKKATAVSEALWAVLPK